MGISRFRSLPRPRSLTQLVSHGPLAAALRPAHPARAATAPAAAAAPAAARPVQVDVDDAPPLLGQLGAGLLRRGFGELNES